MRFLRGTIHVLGLALWLPGWIILMSDGVACAKTQPVFVTASVVDKNGIFLENLEPSEFAILEDGQPRKLEFVAKDETPAIYGILFDRGMFPEHIDDERFGTSSISSALWARSIAYELIDKYLGRQAIWVAAYEQEFQLLSDTRTDAFAAKNAIQQLRGRRRVEDSFLYAALWAAVQKMNTRQERRRVVILFITDVDIETGGKIKMLKNLLSASNVELFVVAFTTRLSTRPGALQSQMSTTILNDLVQVTCGSAFFSTNYRDHYEDIVRRMHHQLRTYYTLGFEAEAEAAKPGKLEIQCSRPGSKVTHHPTIPVLQ